MGKADRVAVFDCWHILLINFFAALPKQSSCPGSELLSAGAAQPWDLCHAFPQLGLQHLLHLQPGAPRGIPRALDEPGLCSAFGAKLGPPKGQPGLPGVTAGPAGGSWPCSDQGSVRPGRTRRIPRCRGRCESSGAGAALARLHGRGQPGLSQLRGGSSCWVTSY